jgi:hypothetical protein
VRMEGGLWGVFTLFTRLRNELMLSGEMGIFTILLWFGLGRR